MIISEFVKNFKEKKVMNTKIAPDAVQQYIIKELEIKRYISFTDKRKIAETIVETYTKEVDGIKKYDAISAYVGFVMASIMAHTNLSCSDDPVADYDLLAESGLLSQIVAEFQESHNEIDILLKMALASELEDNNVNVLIGHFLDKISKTLDVVGDKIKDLNLNELIGADIKKEDLAKLSSLLNRLK